MPTDTYGQIVNSSVGRFVAQRAGLPRPVELDRHAPGDPVVRGRVLLGAAPGEARLVAPLARVLAGAGAQTATRLEEPVRSAAAAARLDAAVFNPAAPADQRFKALVRSSFPEAGVSPGLVVGATDGRHYQSVAKAVLRFVPITMRKDDLTRFHGNDERIAIADYMRAITFYERLMSAE